MSNACERHYIAVHNYDKAHWETRGEHTHCSYCGSLSPQDAINLLKKKGTRFSGADWKYGWPHKFYIGNSKFYNSHLDDANDQEFNEFNTLSKKIFGIEWHKHPEKGIGYKAPKTNDPFGYQRSGTIGKDGEPIHG